MYKNYKVVVVVPAGRRRYMSVLRPYLERQLNIIDEIRYWVNTLDPEDIQWMKKVAAGNSGFTVDERYQEDAFRGQLNIARYFDRCIDDNTVYIRLDDDIVWMQEDFIEKIVSFRLENPHYFVVTGNILNNVLVDKVHENLGALPPRPDIGVLGAECMDPVGWISNEFAEHKHRNFLNLLRTDQLDRLRFDRKELAGFPRISINCICWFGSDFKSFYGEVDEDEEPWLTEVKPLEIGRINCICGQALCVHFSFFTQREHLDSTDLLQRYEELSKQNSVTL